jgi:hypothetical protein
VLDRGAPAVGGDDRAGHVAGAEGGQERHDLGNFCGVGGALQRCGGPERIEELACLRSRVYRTGGDRVDPDAAGAELRRPILAPTMPGRPW